MGNTGIGVYVLPPLIEQPIKRGFDSNSVHVVPGRDNEVASVVEAELTQGSRHLVLVQMSRTPISNGDKVDLVLIGQLHLDNYWRWTNRCPTWLSTHLPTSPPRWGEEELAKKEKTVKRRKTVVLIVKQDDFWPNISSYLIGLSPPCALMVTFHKDRIMKYQCNVRDSECNVNGW